MLGCTITLMLDFVYSSISYLFSVLKTDFLFIFIGLLVVYSCILLIKKICWGK